RDRHGPDIAHELEVEALPPLAVELAHALRPRRRLGDETLEVRTGLDFLVRSVVPREILERRFVATIAASAHEAGQGHHLFEVLEIVPGVEFLLVLGGDVEPDIDEALRCAHAVLTPRRDRGRLCDASIVVVADHSRRSPYAERPRCPISKD